MLNINRTFRAPPKNSHTLIRPLLMSHLCPYQTFNYLFVINLLFNGQFLLEFFIETCEGLVKPGSKHKFRLKVGLKSNPYHNPFSLDPKYEFEIYVKGNESIF